MEAVNMINALYQSDGTPNPPDWAPEFGAGAGRCSYMGLSTTAWAALFRSSGAA